MNGLPEEVILRICLYLDAISIARLMLVSKALNAMVKQSVVIMKKVCLELDFLPEAAANETWHEAYLRFSHTRNGLINGAPTTNRTFYDMRSLAISQLDDLSTGNLRETGPHSTCSKQLKIGDVCLSQQLSKSSKTKNWLVNECQPYEKLRTAGREESPFYELIKTVSLAYAFNKSFFVLIQSEYLWLPEAIGNIMVWKMDSDSVSLLSLKKLDFVVESQDICLAGHYLCLLPTVHLQRPGLLLQIFDVESTEIKEAFSYDLREEFDDQINRAWPQFGKESGERRIYHIPSPNPNEDIIVVVAPIPYWVIFVYKLTESIVSDTPTPRKKKSKVKEHERRKHLKVERILAQELPEDQASTSAIGQIFSSDCNSAVLLLNFYGEESAIGFSRPLLVIVKFFHLVSCCEGMQATVRKIYGGDPKCNSFFLSTQRFPVSKSVPELGLYLSCLTNYCMDQNSSIVHHRKVERTENWPISVCLSATDSLVVFWSKSEKAIKLGARLRTKFEPNDWHWSELLVSDKLVVVAQQRRDVIDGSKAMHINCFRFDIFEHVWSLKPAISSMDRLYLHCDVKLLWLSETRQCSLVSLETGKLVKTLAYFPYKRCVREFTEKKDRLLRQGETTIYAQAGQSVWHIDFMPMTSSLARVKGRLIVVHDIERLTPIVFDVVDFKI